MTAFRPCIDLHQGKVKQIVGGTLTDTGEGLRTNFVSEHDAAWFAELYKRDGLTGGHIIMLGSGNDREALSALKAWPGGMQVGGGLDDGNFGPYLDAGASHVIVTSWLFPGGVFSMERLRRISGLAGKDRLVVDLSCRRRGAGWFVATNRWQTVTQVRIEASLLESISGYCAEFLIHAADVEGRQQGVEWELVDLLAKASPIPTTYAGGARDISDLDRMETASAGRLDLSIGSALDIFGGKLIRYSECADWTRGRNANDGPEQHG
ncbi:MAG: 1-(5-phosphoribosyl)-5-[(5- phosphoribosylamino)methylideneamino] imidazole-4-carboxamide [Fibrobacteres bacterium]|nr:1-(5-phosphoribosyl)-5-[(5- phosphoribosylamino)methylideneamino] imidazole-4-carboxamide [Fibrobacterota bacterium]